MIGHNRIGGQCSSASSGATFSSRNPADIEEVIGTVPQSGCQEIEDAVRAAREAFPSWALTPAPHRGEILFAAAEMIKKKKQELGELVTREMGKVLTEGLGDVQEAIDMTYYMAGEGRRLSGETVPSELPNKDAKSLRVPLGVCGLITPWNFPMAIPAWKIAPALVAGNTIVFKPSSLTPICATRLADIYQEAGLPPGVLNVVHGYGGEVGEALVNHPDVKVISFTGSSQVGEKLAALCGRAHKTFSMETGGKNPIIIMDDANVDLAVEGCIWGGFGTSGQRCTAASRVIVHAAIYERFLAQFLERTKRLRVGNGLKPGIDVGPVAGQSQFEKILRYIEVGKQEGARLLTGGVPLTQGEYGKGFYITPTIFSEVVPAMRIAREEIFGPVVCVLRAGGFREAIGIANDVPYGLSAAIYTQNVNYSAMAERDLESGIVYINASTIGAEIQLPFGGTKQTGLGPREAGGRGGALDLYTKWKVIYRDFSGKLQRAQIDT